MKRRWILTVLMFLAAVIWVPAAIAGSYTIGRDADGYYILRVPMDALDPAEAGTARSGDIAMIFLNNESEPIGSVTLGERGTVQRLDLELIGNDSDGDGLHDDWEIANFDNLTHSNGLTDSDGDGESDLEEYYNGTAPNDPPATAAG